MKHNNLSTIYRIISEGFDNLHKKHSLILDDKGKSILSTVLENTMEKAEDNGEDVQIKAIEWMKNIENFLKQSSNMKDIMEMQIEDRAIYMSFIAYGTNKEIHKSALLEFATNQLTEDILEHEEELELDGEDKDKNEHSKIEIRKKINDIIMDIISEVETDDYMELLGSVGYIVKARRKLKEQMLELFRSSMLRKMEMQKEQFRKKSLLSAIAGGILGFGIGAYNGFSLIDMILPFSFGLSGGVISSEYLKIKNRQKLRDTDLDINKIDTTDLKKSAIKELKREQKKLKMRRQAMASRELSEASKSFQKYSLKVDGVFANTCHVVENTTKRNREKNTSNKSIRK